MVKDPVHWKYRHGGRELDLCATTKKDRRYKGVVILQPVARHGAYWAYGDDTFTICERCNELGESSLHTSIP